MSIEQERPAFEAWAASIGFCVTGKYAETIDVLCAESAFKAGYQAGRAALLAERDALLEACCLAARYLNPDQFPDAVKKIDAAIAAANGGGNG